MNELIPNNCKVSIFENIVSSMKTFNINTTCSELITLLEKPTLIKTNLLILSKKKV